MEQDQETIEQVLSAEKERIRCLLNRDMDALEALLDTNLLHVHTTGRLETYETYLTGVRDNLEFLTIERGALSVRIFGDTAVMIGPMDQHLHIKSSGSDMQLAAIATQVWVRSGGRWKLASFHACRSD